MHLSLGGLLHFIRVGETTPPLYFLVAWLWAKVFGTGEAGLRSLSALLGVGLIPIGYACGRQLVSRSAGVLTAALVAASPFMIWYSQEARSYMLFAVFCGLSFLFFARQWARPARRDLILWTAFSALAVLTHFFAGFLIAPEAVVLLWRARDRATALAIAAVAAVQLAVLPLAIGDTSHPLQWIKAFPLAVRIKQVPVDFALSTLFQSQAVTYGLVGAAGLAAVVLGLLVFGGDPERRRPALLCAAVVAFVVLVPLLLAALGRDYVVPRNFIPAWIPLAVLIAAACTAPRTLPLGAALAALLLAAFVYTGAFIDSHSQYERPNWRGVARALGPSSATRAIVAYDGGYAAQPLAVYLPRVPWQLPAGLAVRVREVDVIGSTYQAVPQGLPAGVRVLGRRAVDGFMVVRFAVPDWRLSTTALGRRAGLLFAPAPAAPAVLVQYAPA
jgi:uncharacterized membrane protein